MLLDLVYIYPGGVRTGLHLFFFWKSAILKHPSVHFSMSTIYKINDNYSNLSFATIWRFCELAKCPSKWNKRLQTRNPSACYCTLLMVIAIKKPKGNCLQKICMLYTFEHIALPSFPAIWVYGTIFPINNNRDNLFGKLALCWPNFWIGQNF